MVIVAVLELPAGTRSTAACTVRTVPEPSAATVMATAASAPETPARAPATVARPARVDASSLRWIMISSCQGEAEAESPASLAAGGRAVTGSERDATRARVGGHGGLHAAGGVGRVRVRDGLDAAAGPAGAGTDQQVAPGDQGARPGRGLAQVVRVGDTLEGVVLDQHAGAGGGGHAVPAVVAVVVVVDVHRIAETHPRVPLGRRVEPVVVVGHPQVAGVLRGVVVAVAQQHRLVVVVDAVPRHRDEVGAALDVDGAVVAGREGVVVDPDVGGRGLH